MNNSILWIGITIFIISISIYIIKNKDVLINLGRYKEKKIFKYIVNVMFLILIILFILFIYNQTNKIIELADWYKTSKENDLMFEEYDKKISEENKFYKQVNEKDYANQKFSEPYIPEGFYFVEGTWDKGFVIQDNNGNQYVWVPCTNKENENVEKLQRLNFSTKTFISKDLCNNSSYEEFLVSALENGGFYISRFEIGKESDKPVSKNGVEIWKDVTRDEAEKIIDTMYENVNCKLINGYAYDTTLSWIMNTNVINTNILDVNEKTSSITGKQAYNNIFDFTDNIMELTSEEYYSNIIVRGFPYEINKENKDIILQNFGYDIENFDRFSIMENENYFTITTLLGFRTIIYK